MNIYEISTKIRNIYDELMETVDSETGEIDIELVKELEISKGELQEKAIDYGYVIKSFDDEISLYDKEIKRLQDRKKQLSNIKNKVSDTLLNAMESFEIDKIKGKTLTISLRKSKRVNVYDESKLHADFWRTKIEQEPDKTKIKDAISHGFVVDGAEIEEKNNLQIK